MRFTSVGTRDVPLISLSRNKVAFKMAENSLRCCFRYLDGVFEHVLFFRNCKRAIAFLFAKVAFVKEDA